MMLKIDFDKVDVRVDWSFISKMLTCLGFGPKCVNTVSSLFSNTLAFVLIKLCPLGSLFIGLS